MVDITYRTLGPWGSGKGANLQPSEVDANFYSLAQAIVNIQDNPEEPNGIYSITVSGTQMTITLNDGTILGPYTLPVLTFRWRGEWQSTATYAQLDVFTVANVGIFMVQIAHTGDGSPFDPDRVDDAGTPYFLWMFGSTTMSLSLLGDVELTDIQDQDFLRWHSVTGVWQNIHLGQLAYQDYWMVNITGGTITGMPPPVNPTDVATKAYVDAMPAGMTAPDGTIMANIIGYVNAALPNTLSDILDYTLGSSVRGTLLHRTDTGWVALPPGISGEFLQTQGAGLDIQWAAGGAGVTAISAGTGLAATPGVITSTGSLALADVADDTLLANTSGAAAAPVPTTLTTLLDSVLGTTRGQILARGVGGWAALAPGISGHFLKTTGTGSDVVWDSPAGAGTVTSISAGSGISTGGSPITGTGTVSLATIATASLLANITGSTAVPVALTASVFFDSVFGATQGSVLYRSATAWVVLAPGTSGQFLSTGGSAANPSWANAPITGSSTPNLRIVSNVSGSTAVPTGNTLTNILDAIIGSARGTMLYRTNSGWTGLAPGTIGQVLQTGGAGGDPSWITNGGGFLAITTPVSRDILSYNSSSGKFENVRPKYEVSAYIPGTLVANQNLLYHKFSKSVTIPANFGPVLGHNSVAGCSVASTGAVSIAIARAPVATPTTFSGAGSITFTSSGVIGTFPFWGAQTYAQGDIMRVRGPATPDATFADLHFSLVGYET